MTPDSMRIQLLSVVQHWIVDDTGGPAQYRRHGRAQAVRYRSLVRYGTDGSAQYITSRFGKEGW